MTEQQVMRMALEALEEVRAHRGPALWGGCFALEIDALRQALEQQPADEPVAWVSTTELLVMQGNKQAGAKDWRINVGLIEEDGDVGLYTHPPQRKPLTFEQVEDCFPEGAIFAEDDGWLRVSAQTLHDIVRNVEAAHGIKGEA